MSAAHELLFLAEDCLLARLIEGLLWRHFLVREGKFLKLRILP
jgi:hypothetical protein